MMNLELPFIEGFYYYESEDEWRLDLSDGYLTLWKNQLIIQFGFYLK
jgi:hypothetical protein